MKKNDPITNILTQDVATVQDGQKLSDVRDAMCNLNIHHVPVLKGKELLGLVSFTDMMKINLVVSGADERSVNSIIDQQFTISDVMSVNLETLNIKGTVRDAAKIMARGDFHSLPITDDNGNLAGIVTSTDLIRYLSDQY